MLYSTALWSLLATIALASSWITPGATWLDTSGNPIDAHGLQVMQIGKRFYWIGHNRAGSATVYGDVTPTLYTSNDLINWDFAGHPAPGFTNTWRPKILAQNGAFFINGQQDRLVLTLRSRHLNHGYRQISKDGLQPNNWTYSDTGIFWDEDTGISYLLTSAQSNNIQVNRILADGTVGERVSRLQDGPLEAAGIFKEGGIYFIIVSGKTGYRANPNKVYWSESINGPWVGGTDIAPPSTNTYGSQNSHELTIKGTQQTTHIYLGDIWTPATGGVGAGGVNSTYLFLPISVDVASKNVTLQWYDRWRIDTTAGVVSYPVSKKRYEAEDAGLTGTASTRDCTSCLSRRSVHQVTGPSEVKFQNVLGTGALQWVSVHYKAKTGKDTLGDAYLVVNNQPAVNISSLNSYAGHHKSIPVQLTLNKGENNNITIGTYGEGFDIEVDGLEIFEEDFEEL